MTARNDLARLLEQATPGPWLTDDEGSLFRKDRRAAVDLLGCYTFRTPSNAPLVVFLRNHADRLLALWEAAARTERELVYAEQIALALGMGNVAEEAARIRKIVSAALAALEDTDAS